MMTRAVVGVRFETRLELGASRAFRRGKRGAVQPRIPAHCSANGRRRPGTHRVASEVTETVPDAGPTSRWCSGGALHPYSGGVHSLTNGKPLSAEKEIVFVRHGLSTWNQEGRIQGDTDESTLTAAGEEQSQMVRDSLVEIPFDSCFSSPITRARTSADIMWEGREGELIYLDNLREANLSVLQGMRNVDAAKELPDLFGTWREVPHEFCLDGIYPIVDVWERATEAWKGEPTYKRPQLLPCCQQPTYSIRVTIPYAWQRFWMLRGLCTSS